MSAEISTLAEQAVNAFAQTGTRLMNFFNAGQSKLPQELQFNRGNFNYDRFMDHSGQWTELARTPNYLQKDTKNAAVHTFTPRRHLTNYSITQGNKTIDGVLSHVPSDKMSFGLLVNGAVPMPLPYHMAGFYDKHGHPCHEKSSDYSYAVMTQHPSNAWVLGRQGMMDRPIVARIVQLLRSAGFPVNIFNPHLGDLTMSSDSPLKDAVEGKLAEVEAELPSACCVVRPANPLYDDLVGCGYDSSSESESECENNSKSSKSSNSSSDEKKYYGVKNERGRREVRREVRRGERRYRRRV